jgi:hypothetical protein
MGRPSRCAFEGRPSCARVDLKVKVEELVQALSTGNAEPFLAERLVVDLDGQRHARNEVLAWLVTAPVGIKRNLTFVDWVWRGVGQGVGVLSWDQEGKVVHALVQKRK